MAAKRNGAVWALVLALAVLAGCKQFSFYSALGDRLNDNPLTISPASVTVFLNATFTFTATGGQAPYSYAVVSGTGTIDAGTGLYTAPGTAGTDTVQATDNAGGHSNATVNVTNSSGPLAISPTSVTMGPGGSLTFVASGGTEPYSFSLQTMGSGSPSINASTGAYTAGASIGTDIVRVQDALAATADASVTVTAAVTNVDYTVSATSFPLTAAGGSTILAGDGYTFTVENAGLAGGTKTVTWWVYLSDDASLGSGDTLLSSGSFAALPPSPATEVVPLTASLPVASGAKRLFVMVSAADDLSVGNNTSAGIPLTLTLPDYTGALSDISGTTASRPFTFNLTITNNGLSKGSSIVTWNVYASLGDKVISADDKVVASGTIPVVSALGAGASTPLMPYGNTWPAAAGTYYLVADIIAADDGDTTDNQPASSGIPVSVPQVDYLVQNVQYTGGAVNPGASFNGSFDYKNQFADKGVEAGYWTVYASLNDVLDGSDTWVAGGPAAPLNGLQLSTVNFSGAWPLDYGNYYLLVTISNIEDLDGSNNTTASVLSTAIGNYNAIIQNGNCNNLTFYTDLNGVVLQPGMSLKVRSTGFPAGQTDHLFRLHTGTASKLTASWVLDAATLQGIGVFYYKPPGNPAVDGYWIDNPALPPPPSGLNKITLTFNVDASDYRWIDLYNAHSVNLGAYTLYITAN